MNKKKVIHKYVYECVVTTLHVNGFRPHLSLVYQDKGLFLVVCDHRFEWRIIILLLVFINSWFTFMYTFVVYGKHKYVQRSKIYSWGKRIWMANYTSLTLIWCACIFVDSLSKKRERDANLHHVHITLKSLICASYKHVLISPKKNHTLKDEIIISAQ